MRALDGLRGVAVAAVVVYHLFPSALPGGFLGVDVFFVLSGFLIASIVVEEVATSGGLDIRAFYLRRARRLAPALLLLIAGVCVYGATWATAGELDRLRKHSLWALGYLANWKLIFDGTTYTDIVAGASPLRHTWSLAIEEQFYVVFPAVVLALVAVGRLADGPHALRRRLFVIAVAGTLASALAMASLWGDGSNPSRGYFGTDARAQSLLVGVALGALLVGRPPATGRSARIAAWAGATGAAVLVIAMAVADESARWLQHGGFLLVAVAVGGVVSALECAAWLRRPLSARPLVGLGLISYGVYLWHWPVIVVMDEARTGIDGPGLGLLRLALTLGLSLASYWLVEQPIRHGALGTWLGRATAPAVALAVSLLVVGVIASTGSTPLEASTRLAASAAAAEPATGSAAQELPATGSIAPTLQGEPASEGRRVSGGAAAPSESGAQLPIQVVVLGDSVAHTLAGGVVGAFPEFAPWAPEQSPFDPADVQLWSVAKPACSFLPGSVVVDGLSAADLSAFCGDWRTDLAAALAARPGAVVLVALTNDVFDRRVEGETVVLGTDAHDHLLHAFLDDVRATASRRGGHVALLALPPRVGGLVPAGDEGGHREALLRASYARYAAERPDVRLLDLSEEICPAGDCGRPPRGYDPAWRYDGLHFSAPGAQWVAGWITGALLDR